MRARYDIRPDPDGWTVYDTVTGSPTAVKDVTQTGLSLEDADDLADLLNRLHNEQSAPAAH
jgi:hypothetical protein